MNFYKKALVASAIVASFGASAAKITPSTSLLKISKEGIAANITIPDAGFDINVKTEALTSAASNIKIQFGAGVDLTTPKANLAATVTQTAAPDGASTSGDMSVTFGTGSFTFDNFAIDTTTADAHFVTFDVSVGQPIAQGAAFNVAFATGKVGKASSATYTATDTGVVIDSGGGAIAEEVDQFTFAMGSKFDGVINRTSNITYTPAATADELSFDVTNVSTLSRAITATGATALLKGNFKDVLVTELAAVAAAVGAVVPTVPTADKEILLTLDGAGTTAAATKVTLTVDHAGTAIPASGEVDVVYTVLGDFDGGTKVFATADGGEWEVDATIINVPYLPVGYDGVTSTIQLANEGTSIVDVIVTANDKMGNQYGPVNLNTLPAYSAGLPAQAVSKVSDVDIMSLLSAPAESSLSITFNIDANEGVVNGYAYTQKAGTGRTEVSTSQQRGN